MSKKRVELDTKRLVGRSELVTWLNKTLRLRYKKVEDAANGAACCQLIDMVHPGTVPLGRVNFAAQLPHECMENLKILQDAFNKNGIDEVIDVDALSKGRYVAALHLLQFLFNYVASVGVKGKYDAAARRQQSHCREPGASSPRPKAAPQAGGVPMFTKSLKRGAFVPRTPSGGASPATSGELSKSDPPASPKSKPKEEMSPELKKTIATLQRTNRRLQEDLEQMTEERDFYYEKLRKVEEFCQDHESDVAYVKILDILYETDEARGFVAPDEAERLDAEAAAAAGGGEEEDE